MVGFYDFVFIWIQVSGKKAAEAKAQAALEKQLELEKQLQAVRLERDTAQTRLAPFLAVAEMRFTNEPPNKRLDLLIEMVKHIQQTVESAQTKQRDRTIDKLQAEAMVKLLRSAPKHPVTLIFRGADDEVAQLVNMIEEVLRAAQIPLTKTSIISPDPFPPGINMTGGRGEELVSEVNAIKKALSMAGIECATAQIPSSEEPINMRVGRKPPN
ncbi:MAG: hypothetical protein DME19_13660 [Verrucomicrobia bacterium]|nr:MAG: hypothetical protein DME19_13660 [Verrucomicrobiota bacterium]